MPPKGNIGEFSVQKLVNEIKKRECVWNTESDEYNDRYQTAIAWKEISEALQLPIDLLRMKWKNLRDSFKKELKKTGATCVEDYNGKWPHMELLSFMEKPSDNEASTTETEREEKEDIVSFSSFTDTNFVDVQSNGNNEEEIDVPVPEKRRKTYAEEEYDLMFLKSLAPFFRDLEPVRKLVLRSKIQDLVMNEIAAQNSSNKLYMMKKS
ncbi:uncharacterized protein LOC113513295 [Galleria mellonella]|uniref:Uncharacterized protein LOC113513295 n=1 Tax=Galleria mellonella TaxID=7137 RepID=A0A6J1WGH8_GALME|nr:uncharacterized protein LOC113513295 [Galleria mellonella]